MNEGQFASGALAIREHVRFVESSVYSSWYTVVLHVGIT